MEAAAMTPQVLYTQFGEPITVVKVTQEFLRELEQHKALRVPVQAKVNDTTTQTDYVRVYLETAQNQNFRFMWTPDEVLALELKPSILPGQQRLIKI